MSLPLWLLAVGCSSNKPPYAKVGYDGDKLTTPPHNLSAYEYPFDDDGTYRKDWVTDKNAKRPKKWFGKKSSDSSSSPSTTVASNTTPPPPPTRTTTSGPPPSAYTPPPPRPAPAPKPTPPKARYHTVAKGDTLFGISRRYGVSVTQLKSTNGLRSDLIRIGQTLRVP